MADGAADRALLPVESACTAIMTVAQAANTTSLSADERPARRFAGLDTRLRRIREEVQAPVTCAETSAPALSLARQDVSWGRIKNAIDDHDARERAIRAALDLLWAAAQRGDTDEVAREIRARVIPGVRQGRGCKVLAETLRVAAANGWSEMVSVIMGAAYWYTHPDIEAYDQQWSRQRAWSHAFVAAAWNGCTDVICVMLGAADIEPLWAGYDMDDKWPTEGNAHTALTGAAVQGHCACMELLLQRKAHTSVEGGPEGAAPLWYAAFYGNMDVVRLLLQAKADPRMGGEGDAPLRCAAARGRCGVVCALLQAKADVDDGR